MFNNFDGDFRRKPVVSIRGASKKENKEELLQRTQKERNQREVSFVIIYQRCRRSPEFEMSCLHRIQILLRTLLLSTILDNLSLTWFVSYVGK